MDNAVVQRHGGEEWIRLGDTLFRPQDGVPELAAGPATVTFGLGARPTGAAWRPRAASRSVQAARDASTTPIWRVRR